MAKEIERKYLVRDRSFKTGNKALPCRQGYISSRKEAVVRVRIIGDEAYLTIKGENKRYSRDEYEYPIPLLDAQEMLENLCENYVVEKKRYKVLFQNKLWYVDEFEGTNEGLILAEIELDSEEENFVLPDWAGKEITEDYRYSGLNLSIRPYVLWEKEV